MHIDSQDAGIGNKIKLPEDAVNYIIRMLYHNTNTAFYLFILSDRQGHALSNTATRDWSHGGDDRLYSLTLINLFEQETISGASTVRARRSSHALNSTRVQQAHYFRHMLHAEKILIGQKEGDIAQRSPLS